MLNETVKQDLKGIVGPTGVIDAPEDLLAYSYDACVEEWIRVDAANREIFEMAMKFNGTLSGEHGIGLTKTGYLPMTLDDATRAFMNCIKKCVDPQGILNPGKFV
jgi:FAD/FMN-containing dehydrogenase